MLKNHKIKQKLGVLNFLALLLIFLALAGAGALMYLNGRYIFIYADKLLIYYGIGAVAFLLISVLIIVLVGSGIGSYLARSVIKLKDSAWKMVNGESAPIEHYSSDELSELAEALRALAAARSLEAEDLKQARRRVSELEDGGGAVIDERVLTRAAAPFAGRPVTDGQDKGLASEIGFAAAAAIATGNDDTDKAEGQATGAAEGSEESELRPGVDDVKKNSEAPNGIMGSFSDVIDKLETDDSKLKELSEKTENVKEDAEGTVEEKGGADEEGIIGQIKEPAMSISASAAEAMTNAEFLSLSVQAQTEQIEKYRKSVKTAEDAAAQNARLSEEALAGLKENIEMANRNIEDLRRLTVAANSIVDSSRRISETMKILDDVAFRTNMLSLNAAVEAARAGQAGKGFGVIADEIRSLSSRSQSAVKETAELIKENLGNADAIDELVKKTNKNIASIELVSSDCSGKIEKVSDSSKAQMSSIEDAGAGLERISGLLDENAALAEKSGQAAQDLTKRAEELYGVIRRFEDGND